mmetsp:Transcript_781/g.2485  ORF Transcript_781/g.2485 Transcript_781/m.2485 type:complete len:266 (-) Transcript_781:335-1132(-)
MPRKHRWRCTRQLAPARVHAPRAARPVDGVLAPAVRVVLPRQLRVARAAVGVHRLDGGEPRLPARSLEPAIARLVHRPRRVRRSQQLAHVGPRGGGPWAAGARRGVVEVLVAAADGVAHRGDPRLAPRRRLRAVERCVGLRPLLGEEGGLALEEGDGARHGEGDADEAEGGPRGVHEVLVERRHEPLPLEGQPAGRLVEEGEGVDIAGREHHLRHRRTLNLLLLLAAAAAAAGRGEAAVAAEARAERHVRHRLRRVRGCARALLL